jgi:hypothetical protein
MTMTEQQSMQWQSDSVATYVASLKASLGDNVNNDVIDAMEQLYRTGWNDCYRLAKLNQYDIDEAPYGETLCRNGKPIADCDCC